MKALLLAAAMLTVPGTAFACRHFSRWHYPWPQACSQRPLRVRPPAAEADKSWQADKSWYVEIVLTPKVIDEISHGIGIERIRRLSQEPQ